MTPPSAGKAGADAEASTAWRSRRALTVAVPAVLTLGLGLAAAHVITGRQLLVAAWEVLLGLAAEAVALAVLGAWTQRFPRS
jgi:hypothetical protein